MIINNDNYEEYFLLYADNELSKYQRIMVEAFIADRPELQKELAEILLTVQKPESDTPLPDLSFLLKSEEELFINSDNFEERFVEYHDGELNEHEKALTASYIKKHTDTQEGFSLIGIARLEPETQIVFPHKERLYRNTATVRSLFIKYAAAAAIAALAISGIYYLADDNRLPTHLALNNETKITPPPVAKPAPPSATANKKYPSPVQVATTGTPHQAEKAPESSSEKKEKILAPSRQEEAVHHLTVMADGIYPDAEEVKAPNVSGNTIKDGIPVLKVSGELYKEALTRETASEEMKAEPSLALLTSDTNPDSYVLDIPTERISRTKLGGFIKKVKRTIDRSNPINMIFNED